MMPWAKKKKKSPQNSPKPKTTALTCRLISKDGRKYIEGMATTSLQQLRLLYLNRRREGTVEKVTIFLLLILSWGWSNFVGGILFLFSFDLISFISPSVWDTSLFLLIDVLWHQFTEHKHPNWWGTALHLARWWNLRGRFIIPEFLFGCSYLHPCKKIYLSKSFKTLITPVSSQFSHLGK